MRYSLKAAELLPVFLRCTQQISSRTIVHYKYKLYKYDVRTLHGILHQIPSRKHFFWLGLLPVLQAIPPRNIKANPNCGRNFRRTLLILCFPLYTCYETRRIRNGNWRFFFPMRYIKQCSACASPCLFLLIHGLTQNFLIFSCVSFFLIYTSYETRGALGNV